MRPTKPLGPARMPTIEVGLESLRPPDEVTRLVHMI